MIQECEVCGEFVSYAGRGPRRKRCAACSPKRYKRAEHVMGGIATVSPPAATSTDPKWGYPTTLAVDHYMQPNRVGCRLARGLHMQADDYEDI